MVKGTKGILLTQKGLNGNIPATFIREDWLLYRIGWFHISSEVSYQNQLVEIKRKQSLPQYKKELYF